jgi:hypothetical protein
LTVRVALTFGETAGQATPPDPEGASTSDKRLWHGIHPSIPQSFTFTMWWNNKASDVTNNNGNSSGNRPSEASVKTGGTATGASTSSGPAWRGWVGGWGAAGGGSKSIDGTSGTTNSTTSQQQQQQLAPLKKTKKNMENGVTAKKRQSSLSSSIGGLNSALGTKGSGLVDPNYLYELEAREEQRRAQKVTAKDALWFEEDLLKRKSAQAYLSKYQVAALQLITRQRRQQEAGKGVGAGVGGTDNKQQPKQHVLSAKDRALLKQFTLQGIEEREDRKELAFLLEQQKTNAKRRKNILSIAMAKQAAIASRRMEERIRHLQLLQRKRSGNTTQKLTRVEDKELKKFEAHRQQEIADMNEYYKLFAQSKNGGGTKGVVVDKDQLYELGLYWKRRKGKKMTEQEQWDVRRFDLERIHEARLAKEYSNLLDHKAYGDPVNEDRLRVLELADRRRRNNKAMFTKDEIEDLLLLDEERMEKHVQQLELEDLRTQQEWGEPVNAYRLCELELLDKTRRGKVELTEEEETDLEFYQETLEGYKLEYENLVRRKRLFEFVDESRMALLELVNRRVKRGTFTQAERDKLKLHDAELMEEEEDRRELQKLRALQEEDEDDENFDSARLEELELLERKRQGEDLTERELEDWKRCNDKRAAERPDKIEVAELLGRKKQGISYDEARLRGLELLGRQLRGEDLTDEEQEELDLFHRRRRREKRETRELQILMDRKDKGEKVDEGAIYKLQLLAKKRNYETMTKDEKGAYELFSSGREIELQNEDEEKIAEEERLEEERLEEDRLYKALGELGLPSTLSFGEGDHLQNSTMAEMDIDGNESYLGDLIHQMETQEERRKEYLLEEALGLYQIAVKEKSLPESEELFANIFKAVQKEAADQFAEEDRILKQRIEEETKRRDLNRRKNITMPLRNLIGKWK